MLGTAPPPRDEFCHAAQPMDVEWLRSTIKAVNVTTTIMTLTLTLTLTFHAIIESIVRCDVTSAGW